MPAMLRVSGQWYFVCILVTFDSDTGVSLNLKANPSEMDGMDSKGTCFFFLDPVSAIMTWQTPLPSIHWDVRRQLPVAGNLMEVGVSGTLILMLPSAAVS